MCVEHARFQNAAEFGVGWPGRWGFPASTEINNQYILFKVFLRRDAIVLRAIGSAFELKGAIPNE